jgi:hypothetical protein
MNVWLELFRRAAASSLPFDPGFFISITIFANFLLFVTQL